MTHTAQAIEHGGRIVALVIAGHAIISEQLDRSDLRHVEAMALYAIKITDGEIAGPYTDADAERYATRALQHSDAARRTARPRQARRRPG